MPKKEEKKPTTYSPEMQEALSRVRSYENKYTDKVMNNESNFGFNGFKKKQEEDQNQGPQPLPASNADQKTDGFANQYGMQQYDFSNV